MFGVDPAKHAPDCDLLHPDPEFLYSQWDAGCTCDGDLGPKPTVEDCGTCAGYGVLVASRLHLPRGMNFTCPVCEGTGVL